MSLLGRRKRRVLKLGFYSNNNDCIDEVDFVKFAYEKELNDGKC